MRTILLCLLLCMTSGCASRGPIGSFAGPLPEQNAVSAIAGDAVTLLTGLYPPGHTVLYVLPAKEAENAFAQALENGLRAKGFTVAAEAGADTVTVAYTLDNLDEKSAWYLRLGIADGKAVRVMARAYDAQGQPEAGQSRTVLDAGISSLGKAAAFVMDKLPEGARP
ncbi:hypothetical protein FACS1894168_0080 [Deltaproteobacteria bacterium]|nr:hypothetical protein FACS1894168_0080 [Deltaproteobacteria bacterium]